MFEYNGNNKIRVKKLPQASMALMHTVQYQLMTSRFNSILKGKKILQSRKDSSFTLFLC
jgi:hypothetical protein